MNRIRMIRQTEHFVWSNNNYSLRKLSPKDGRQLGQLLYVSYKGTVDDEGATEDESIVEAEDTLRGKYGNIIWDASFVAAADDTLVSTTVITDWAKSNPLLAFVATHPNSQKQGLSANLIQASLSSLHKLNIPVLHLVVTENNDRAIRLYKKLGFQEDLGTQNN